MTVTQYIGAPYIPHGWTTWQPATAYDGMSVVEYNLVWYIAKQPVPIGTTPTGQSDDPYWAAVDRWNGQVEEYRKDVTKMKKSMSEINVLNPPDNIQPLIPNDPTVDNAPLLNNLENYASDNNYNLFFPAGRYYFSTTVQKQPRVSWYGISGTNGTTQNIGIRGTILEYTGIETFINYPTFTSNTYFEYAGLHNLNIRGNNSGKGIGFYMNPGNRQLIFEYVTIVEFSTGLYVQGCGELYLSNVFIRECKYSANFTSSSDSWFYACAFGSGKFLSQYSGIGFQGNNCTALNFFGCRFQHQLKGSGAIFTNCRGALLDGCIADGNEESGIIFNNGENIIIGNCRFYNNPLHAIAIQGNINNIAINNCIAEDGDLVFYGTPTNVVITSSILPITSNNVLMEYVIDNVIGATYYKEFLSKNTNLNAFPALKMAVFGATSTEDISVSLPYPKEGKELIIKKGNSFTNTINLTFRGETIMSISKSLTRLLFNGNTWIDIS